MSNNKSNEKDSFFMSYHNSRTVYKSSNHNRRGSSRSGGNRRQAQYIDPARFIAKAKNVEAEQYVPTHEFSNFEIHPGLKANIVTKGFKIPTPIQDQTIPLALAGKDIIGVANTGTGKTAAFAIPIINKLTANPHSKALIIAPTRELAQQIEEDFRWMAKGSSLFGALLIGGSSMGKQLGDLREKPRIVIGTPGRIQDHLERGTLILATFNTVVLDEVDRMLDMGFILPVTEILSHLNENRQSMFFSATMDHKVKSLIQRFTKDPVTVAVKTGETSDMVNQDIIRTSSTQEKLDKLYDILLDDKIKAIVFDETQRGVERLSKDLVVRGFKADSIHGGKSQGQRQRALAKFKNSDIKILVATDVAARGIDVADITHVINYSQPMSYEDYVHRIGRAGRAGRIGHALTFVN